MSGPITALTWAILAASLIGPPALPRESAPPDRSGERASDPPRDPPRDPPSQTETNPPVDITPPTPPRTSLPPGLQPVPFPLEQRRSEAPVVDGNPVLPPPESAPAQRRSIVDLRDPFDRPIPTKRGSAERAAAARLIMPDLKDPFAPGLTRVRSKRLDAYVPNDIRDPFRARPNGQAPRPPCARQTQDGTVVQTPGTEPECPSSPIDLRDPFTR